MQAFGPPYWMRTLMQPTFGSLQNLQGAPCYKLYVHHHSKLFFFHFGEAKQILSQFFKLKAEETDRL